VQTSKQRVEKTSRICEPEIYVRFSKRTIEDRISMGADRVALAGYCDDQVSLVTSQSSERLFR
jgi:hypothetical protein